MQNHHSVCFGWAIVQFGIRLSAVSYHFRKTQERDNTHANDIWVGVCGEMAGEFERD
jgi:hypothetical protein